jgi:uncharacterized protein
MKNKLWIILALGLVLLAVALAGCGSSQAPVVNLPGVINGQNTGIWVSGVGKVTAVPDTAVISLGVQAQAATVDQAQGQANTSMNAVVAAVKAGGVTDKDIQTTSFSIQQLVNYDKNGQQTIIGYLVNNTVTVKIRTIANTGPIIDSVAKAGGDNTRINSISFTVNDPTQYTTQARQLAMADAKAKATQLASQAGVKLGHAIYINESSSYVPPSPIAISAPQASDGKSTPISAGTSDITINVQVTYSID